MSSQTRYPRRWPEAWSETVGAMKASGTEVYATCSGCGWTLKPLPLDPIIEKLGADYSLFDKRSKCRECPNGVVIYLYRPGGTHGSPFRPCRTTL